MTASYASRVIAITAVALASCASEEEPGHGTAECAAYGDPSCPADCKGAVERRLDVAGKCLVAAPITCARSSAGRTTANGCCARDDGALFLTSHGGPGCPYRAPDYRGFRDCTDEERALFPADQKGC